MDCQDTYAFGDGINDLEMFDYCEVGVAMGNAVELLKQKADLVCRSITDQGLERILKILFPQED
ncbi:HAD hydrolase family protein [Allocoprobacillus halotolerans]|uniref:HAD hydrolase family protein n=1 Tax=Allocoprobacillus halotolerans TaxID=2944914 RepID=A0ABY5HYK0_9FIRM|nr:HAD hydrolase family protein [Allocoprobacillus halotolerans]UTY37795.1 HAD hydrolase family protein [Allocoprobacillus halotolerans]